MTKTVIALYDSFADASNAVRDLVDHGFSRDDISLMAANPENDNRGDVHVTELDDTSGAAEGAGVGAGIGAAIGGLGGLLIGLGALTIPGIGPVVAAGPLAAALTGLAGAGAGAVAGGVTGGLLGALVDMGVPEETAQYYAEGVRRGAHLVSMRAEDHMSDRAVEIMNAHNPMDVNERVARWRESGWSGFDTNAGPYSETEWQREPFRESTPSSSVTNTPAGAGMTDMGSMTTDYSYQDFSHYEDRFRTHFSSAAYPGYTYEQYQPAYRYGYDLAVDETFRDRDWETLEPEAYRRWEERNPGTWEEFKAAVRHAWDEIRNG